MAMESGNIRRAMPRRRRNARFKPDARHGNRARTNSQSSVEIQVSDHDTLSILTTTCSVPSLRIPPQHWPTSSSNNMVLPTTEFLRLLKTVGAQGQDSVCGELFTFKQLCFHLKEYIKYQALYDPNDPLVIHCENDPLGLIFGVKQFTFQDAMPLVMKNTLLIDSSFTKQRRSNSPHTCQVVSPVDPQIQNSRTPSCRDNGMDQVSSTTMTPGVPPTNQPRCLTGRQSETDDEETASKLLYNPSSAVKHLFWDENAHLADEGVLNAKVDEESGEVEPVPSRTNSSQGINSHVTCRSKHEDKKEYTSLAHDSSIVADNGEVKGQRQCCMKNTCGVCKERTSPVAGPSHRDESNKEQNHNNKKSESEGCRSRRRRKRTKSDRISESRHSFSIYYQSENEEGKASQPWCLELELGADSNSDETIYSIQSKETVYVKDSSDDLWFLDEDEISFDIQSTQSTNYQEYEVQSEVDSYHNDQDYPSDGSESPNEEIVAVYYDSDMEFWADSESSDSEHDTTDEEFTSADKWKCEKCDLMNKPLSRHCNRCWELRTGWLSDKREKSNQKLAENNSTLPSSTSDRNQDCQRLGCSPLEGDHLQSLHEQVPPPGASNRAYSKNIVMDRFLSSQVEFNNSPKPELPTSKPYSPIEKRPDYLQRPGFTSSCLKQPDSDTTLLARADTVPAEDQFKVPSSISMPNDESKCTAKGRLLPRLRLPTDDSGVGSLTSSQESSFSVTCNASQETFPVSPLKKPRMASPMNNRVPVSPRKQSISPCKRRSPFPKSPFSTKQNLFAFEPMSSPSKRLYSSDLHNISLTNVNMPTASTVSPVINASPKPETSRRIFFVDPLPSPKKRAANGIEYSDVCMICLSKPKEASIIHGKTGHQVCCYLCAKQLRKRGRPCPVCRRPIQKVIKNYLV